MEKLSETQYKEEVIETKVIVYDMDIIERELEFHKQNKATAENGIAECEAKLARGKTLDCISTKDIKPIVELEEKVITDEVIE